MSKTSDIGKEPFATEGDSTPLAADAPVTQPRQATVEVKDAGINACYANFCRVTGTPEELIVDFGLNPNPVANRTGRRHPANCYELLHRQANAVRPAIDRAAARASVRRAGNRYPETRDRAQVVGSRNAWQTISIGPRLACSHSWADFFSYRQSTGEPECNAAPPQGTCR